MSGAIGLWVRGQVRGRGAGLMALGLLIALVGGVTLGVVGAARRADTAIDRFQAYTRQTNVEVALAFLDQPTPESLAALPTPSELVQRFQGIDGVRGLTGVSFVGAAPGIGGGPPDADAAYFSAVAAATSGDALRMRFVDGRAADLSDPHEVNVNEAAPGAWGVEVGDTMTLHTLAPDQINAFLELTREEPRGPQIELEVVGVFRDLEDITDFPEPIVLMTPAFLDEYGHEVINVTGAAWVNADPQRLDQVIADVQAATPDGFDAGPVTEDFAGRVREVVSVEVTALRVFAAVAGIAGLAVVYQAVSRQLTSAAPTQLVGRALGFGRRQLVVAAVIGMLPALVLGLVGSLALAVAVSRLVPRGVARRADPETGFWVDWLSLLVGSLVCAAILVGVAAVAATLTIRRAGTVPSAHPSTVAGVARRLTGAMPVEPGLGVRYALGGGHGVRRVGWAGLAGVAIGIAGIVAVATVTGSARELAGSPRLWGATWDAATSIEAGSDPTADAAQLAGDADVEAVALGRRIANPDAVVAEGPAGQEQVEPFAFQPVKGDMGAVVTSGRPPSGPDEAAVGAGLARLLGVSVGDTFELRTEQGGLPFRVTGSLVFPGTNELGDRLVLTPAGLDSLVAGCPPDSEALSCSVQAMDLGVRYRPGVDVEEATSRLSAVVPTLVQPDRPSEVNNLSHLGATPWLLAGFLGLLGVAGLAHALVIGGRRQRHDLAVIRVLGLRPSQAAAVVRWQAVVLAGLGTVAGLLVGAVVGRLLWRRIASGIGAIISIDLSPWVLALVPAALAAALLIALYPAHRVASGRPAHVLRSE